MARSERLGERIQVRGRKSAGRSGKVALLLVEFDNSGIIIQVIDGETGCVLLSFTFRGLSPAWRLGMDTLVPGVKNRRRACRRSPKHGERVTCSKTGAAGDNLALALLDLSESGLRLLLREPLRRGQGAEVTLGGAERAAPLTLPATVVWCVDAPAGGYCVGFQLQRQLSDDDLSSLTGDVAVGELASVGMAGRV